MEQILILIILFVYLIVGLIPSVKHAGDRAYIIANKDLNEFQTAATILASKIGGGLLVSYSSLFYLHGTSAFFFFIGATFGYWVYYHLIKTYASNFKNEDVVSLTGLFQEKYGSESYTPRLIGILVTLSMLGWVITNIIAGTQIISSLTEFSELLVLFTLMTIITSYLLIGGFYSVVKTDIIQLIAIIVAFIIVTLAAFHFTSNDSGALFEFQGTEAIGIGKIISFFILGILFPLGSAELTQRSIAARDEKTLRKSLVFTALIYLLAGLLLSLICFKLSSFFQASELNENNFLSVGVAYFFKEQLLLKTIWIIAFISIVVSSADTFIFTSASSFVTDVLKINKSDYVVGIRWSIFLISCFAIMCYYLFNSITDVTVVAIGITLILSAFFIGMRFSGFFTALNNSKYSFLIGLISILSLIFAVAVIPNIGEKPAFALVGFVIFMLLSTMLSIFLKFSSSK